MKRPIFVRPLNDAERNTLEAGLRSSDAFTLRRSARSSSPAIGARMLTRSPTLWAAIPQTARNAIHAFNEEGLPGALRRGSKRPHIIHRAFDPQQAEALRELLHQDPRKFGKQTSL